MKRPNTSLPLLPSLKILAGVAFVFLASAAAAGSSDIKAEPKADMHSISINPDIEGDWGGTLVETLHLILHVKKLPSGEYTAVMESVDQGHAMVPVDKLEVAANHLILSVTAIQGSFDAKWDDKAKAWAGTWTQGPGMPLTLSRITGDISKPKRPKEAPTKTEHAIDTDHEFDLGSRINLENLSAVQVENLATLGKVWGFLKYYHPLITAGQRHWDYDLFRIMPAIIDANDQAAANDILHKWIASIGEVPDCKHCASLSESEIYMRPATDWIDDKSLLGTDLSTDLQKIYRNRSSSGTQFYVKQAAMAHNPIFVNELEYEKIQFPDSGFQLLTLFRFWNIVEYWAPYRDLIGENWDDVLRQSIAKIALAKDKTSYQLNLMALIARVHDTHANLWSSLAVRPPVGVCQLPVYIRFIENKAVVADFPPNQTSMATGLKLGDVVDAIDDVPVSKLVENWLPYYAASNQVTQLRDIARNMTKGACGETKLRVRRENQHLEFLAMRVPSTNEPQKYTHDKSGATFQRPTEDIGYIKLSSIKSVDIPHYLDLANGTKGLIIDIRNYPAEFVVFALGQHLIEKPTDFANFTMGDLVNPGTFNWGQNITLQPQKPYYAGKVVILVDEVSLSQAEYTTMAFRAAPKAIVIGSTTAGADGDASPIPLPGGLKSMISGIGIFYPDKQPTQRVGIVPDIEVRPTIAGIRAGRDELMEAAIAEIEKE